MSDHIRDFGYSSAARDYTRVRTSERQVREGSQSPIQAYSHGPVTYLQPPEHDGLDERLPPPRDSAMPEAMDNMDSIEADLSAALSAVPRSFGHNLVNGYTSRTQDGIEVQRIERVPDPRPTSSELDQHELDMLVRRPVTVPARPPRSDMPSIDYRMARLQDNMRALQDTVNMARSQTPYPDSPDESASEYSEDEDEDEISIRAGEMYTYRELPPPPPPPPHRFRQRRPPCIWEREEARRRRQRAFDPEVLPYETRLMLMDPDTQPVIWREVERMARRGDVLEARRLLLASLMYLHLLERGRL